MEETLMHTFKRYYAGYRAAENAATSFDDALQALAHYVIDRTESLAQEGRLDEVKSLTREFIRIREQSGGSNDTLKERLERELVEEVLNEVH
ncbi:hypothetical protein B5M42_012775 [Paenibacillus athensensis]|uniref:Uncharacterized protein n=1 Tax=Paenibacillus athensensis TaxID=1967502 RepID=A0A4Y8Q6B7_9BACL|nr:hypothetical protein [Paenibacillus athensensis]MCD1259707.1 hypothetical protein [Paenibacillus athensensis]